MFVYVYLKFDGHSIKNTDFFIYIDMVVLGIIRYKTICILGYYDY